jgi:hypothetical protein
MLREMDARKWVVLGLLVLHVAWLVNHMRLVATDQINPWRLGGYGMYTVPNPGYRIQVYDPASPDQPLPVNFMRYDIAIRLTNAGRTFRCANMSSASLLSFFNENRNLIGRNVAFVFGERRFIRSPPSTQRKTQGVVFVNWQDMKNFTAINKFCGREETETVSFILDE